MKMKKSMKAIVALLVALLIAITFTQVVFADNVTIDMFDNYSDNSGAATSVTNIIGSIINIAKIVGFGVAIIMLIVLAIRYIAASPEGKGEIKKSATVYIVGAIILFAASAILQIIQNFATNIG